MRSTLGCGTLASPSLELVVSLLPKLRKSSQRSRVQLQGGRPAMHRQMLTYDMNLHDIYLSYTSGHWIFMTYTCHIPLVIETYSVWLCLMLHAWDMYLPCWVRSLEVVSLLVWLGKSTNSKPLILSTYSILKVEYVKHILLKGYHLYNFLKQTLSYMIASEHQCSLHP